MPVDPGRSKRRYVAACLFSFAVMTAGMVWAILIGKESGKIEHDLLQAQTTITMLQTELDLREGRIKPHEVHP
ncbi:MAG: hypothetical protein K0Q72_542 [Armatimonadetes bacterium]|nr:hypothetical protein [Armatimonadota bacterium]